MLPFPRWLPAVVVLILCRSVAALGGESGDHRRRLLKNETSDGNVLCDFYNTMPASANKEQLINWCAKTNGVDYDTGPCSTGSEAWKAVTCSVVAGVNRVTRLDMYSHPPVTSLGGSLPTSIGGLDALTYLDLNRLSLSGTIPTAFGALTALTYIDFTLNLLSGNIPSSVGGLISLTVLQLQYNSLSGNIPSSLGALTDLIRIDFFANSFISGSIPSSLGALKKITYLHLAGNALSGTIPSSLGELTKLTELYLSNNVLSGPIPDSFCNLLLTITLSVNNNPELTCYPSCLAPATYTNFEKGTTFQCSSSPTGQPTGQPSSRPSSQPSRQPSSAPSQPTPMPTPVPTLSAPANLYRTYHSGPGCDSTPRVYDTMVLNQCSEPTQEQPFYHVNSCKLFANSYSVKQRRFTTDAHSLRRKCAGSIVPTSKVIEHAKLCRRVGRADEARGYVKTHCGAMEVSPLFSREQILLDVYATNECKGKPTRRGIVLNGCHAVHVDGSTKVQYYSHLRYDKAASEATASLVITLVDSQYATNECTGQPLLVRYLSYKKGIYTRATQKRVCQKDPLHGGFFASATHVYSLSSFPTAGPTPAPSTRPTFFPTGQPTRSPTGQPTRSPTGQPSRQPTSQPSHQPSTQPTSQPTNPTSQPTTQPTSRPSPHPSTLLWARGQSSVGNNTAISDAVAMYSFLFDTAGTLRWRDPSGNTVWNIATASTAYGAAGGGSTLTLQADGNLVVKNTNNGVVRWAAATSNTDTTMGIYTNNAGCLWLGNSTSTRDTYFQHTYGGISGGNPAVRPGVLFYCPGSSYSSPRIMLRSTTQNMCVWSLHTMVWWAPGGAQVQYAFQSDGNFVMYTGSATVTTGTALAVSTGVGNALCLQTDGNLVLYSTWGSPTAPAGTVAWASGTNGAVDNYYLLMDSAGCTFVSTSASAMWSTSRQVKQPTGATCVGGNA